MTEMVTVCKCDLLLILHNLDETRTTRLERLAIERLRQMMKNVPTTTVSSQTLRYDSGSLNSST